MTIVPVVRLILDVGSVNGDATSSLLGRLVNLVVRHELGAATLSKHSGDGSS